MARIEEIETCLTLGVVVEKRRSAHPWAEAVWRPVSVYLAGSSPPAPWTILAQEEGVTRYHGGTLDLILHRKESEALAANLMLDRPEIYVALREADGAFPWVPARVSASSYQAQDWEDPGDQIIEKLPMPEAVTAFLQAFVALHHAPEPFKKRKRRDHRDEPQQFSKHPIFMPVTKQ